MGKSRRSPVSIQQKPKPRRQEEAPANRGNQARMEEVKAPQACGEGGFLEAAARETEPQENSIPLRIDFARRLEEVVRGEAVSTDGSLDCASVEALAEWQLAHGLPAHGLVDAPTRMLLEEQFGETLLGEALEPRILLAANAGMAEKYAFYRGVIERDGHGAFVPEDRQLLTIRGVQRAKDGSIVQSDSAQREANLDPDHRHFSGAGNGFDDLFVVLWMDEDGPHVSERAGTVDPNLIWSEDKHNKRGDKEGTAHVRDGQYMYKLSKHFTSHHQKAVLDWLKEHPEDAKTLLPKRGRRGVTYTALVPLSLEVLRDAGDQDDHRLSDKELSASLQAIAERDPRFTDAPGIKTNVHGAGKKPSSLGCLNVSLVDGYVEMVEELKGGGGNQVRVTVIDGSKITGSAGASDD